MRDKLDKFLQSAFIKRFGVCIAILLTAIGFFVASIIVEKSREVEISERFNQQVVESEQSESVAREQYLYDAQRLYDVSAIDVSRKESDDRVAASVFKYATTWDSLASYMSSREELLAQHSDLDPESQLLKEFFPSIEDWIGLDENGKPLYNPFISGVNLSFVSFSSEVIAVEDNVYTYFGEIVVQSRGPSGGSATGVIVATYQTDGNGHILNPILDMAANESL